VDRRAERKLLHLGAVRVHGRDLQVASPIVEVVGDAAAVGRPVAEEARHTGKQDDIAAIGVGRPQVEIPGCVLAALERDPAVRAGERRVGGRRERNRPHGNRNAHHQEPKRLSSACCA
jgi:hypothetical protein